MKIIHENMVTGEPVRVIDTEAMGMTRVIMEIDGIRYSLDTTDTGGEFEVRCINQHEKRMHLMYVSPVSGNDIKIGVME